MINCYCNVSQLIMIVHDYSEHAKKLFLSVWLGHKDK